MGEQSGWQVAGTAPEMMERYIGPAFATAYEELVALAALHGGERVLDVACGTGGVTRRVAQVVGATGKGAGLDVNEGMLSMARTVPHRHDGPPLSGTIAMRQRCPSLMRPSMSCSANMGSNSLPIGRQGSARWCGCWSRGGAWCCGSGGPWSGNRSTWR